MQAWNGNEILKFVEQAKIDGGELNVFAASINMGV